MIITCEYCGKSTNKPMGQVNRARKAGLRLFCNRKCAGLGRRKNLTKAELIERKRLYDMEYRTKNSELLKEKKRRYYKETMTPEKREKERQTRKLKMARHVEYCQRPEYREKKKKYDRRYRANKYYGEFGECLALVLDIRDECLSRMSDDEIRIQAGTFNKKQRRRKDYERLNSNKSENGPLGYAG